MPRRRRLRVLTELLEPATSAGQPKELPFADRTRPVDAFVARHSSLARSGGGWPSTLLSAIKRGGNWHYPPRLSNRRLTDAVDWYVACE